MIFICANQVPLHVRNWRFSVLKNIEWFLYVVTFFTSNHSLGGWYWGTATLVRSAIILANNWKLYKSKWSFTIFQAIAEWNIIFSLLEDGAQCATQCCSVLRSSMIVVRREQNIIVQLMNYMVVIEFMLCEKLPKQDLLERDQPQIALEFYRIECNTTFYLVTYCWPMFSGSMSRLRIRLTNFSGD